ncbi:MAG: dephospho-CoA kinase [Bacteroidetes bacterium]|nr:dephospho-CoA kinase [Bacteroidota bacterium]
MIKVGLTGGIGSGKTLVSKVFIRLGIPVFNADYEAKVILNSDKETIKQVKKEFGSEIYTDQGIDRKKLAEIIFNNITALQKINAIIHPRVRQYFYEWLKKQKVPYVIEEAAILFESGANQELDLTINVHADELVRVRRVMLRDNTTEETVKSRMKNQMSDRQREKLADYTIHNNGDRMLLPQILEIHQHILSKSK